MIITLRKEIFITIGFILWISVLGTLLGHSGYDSSVFAARPNVTTSKPVVNDQDLTVDLLLKGLKAPT